MESRGDATQLIVDGKPFLALGGELAVFGSGWETEDLFMAWHYARYIGKVAEAGKAEYNLPMFANAALIRPDYAPGQNNSGGPLPHSFDIWKAGGPQLDFLAPASSSRGGRQSTIGR
jgi:hypothetical protein